MRTAALTVPGPESGCARRIAATRSWNSGRSRGGSRLAAARSSSGSATSRAASCVDWRVTGGQPIDGCKRSIRASCGLSQVENGLTVCRASCRPGQACYHFTGFTESADAEDVIALLREYHAAVGEKIIKYSGTLERYAGDGVMVVFNDPVPVENPAQDGTERGASVAPP